MVREVKNLEEFNQILKEAGGKLVVVDFTATWCGPCQMIKPIFQALSEKNPNCIFLKVDVDDAADVSAHCKITSMPTFQFYKNGHKLEEFSGANEKKLVDTIKKHL